MSSGPTTETGTTAAPVSISLAFANGARSIAVTSPSSPSASWRARMDSVSFLRGQRFSSMRAAYAGAECFNRGVKDGTVTVALEVEAEPQAAFDVFLEELATALGRSGIEFEPGPDGEVREGGFEVGRVTEWDPPAHVAIRWRAAEWDPEDALLEIGCGGGAFLAEALRSGCRAAGVDHSPEMIGVASELNSDAIAEDRLELAQADAARLPFADDAFTCAAMMQVFFFFVDPAGVLAECRRVLRDGGR